MVAKCKVTLFFCLLLLSCKKDSEYDFPLVYTGEVTSISGAGATFNGKIVDLGKVKIRSFGFVWDTENNPAIEGSEKFEIERPPQLGTFSQDISTTLQQNVTYYVRAYVQSSNYVTYGKEVAFRSLGSLAPTIKDILPKTGNLNDTLLIVGKNFSYKSDENIVTIGAFDAKVFHAGQDTLQVIIPANLNTPASVVAVSIQGNSTQSKDNFNLIPPVIDSFSPDSGTFGSQITISGDNFMSSPNSIHVYMDKAEAKVVSIQKQSLTMLVPDSLSARQSTLKVVMNNLSAQSVNQFQLASISLTDYNPKIAVTGSTITLTGNNFSPISSNNIVIVGNLHAAVTFASGNTIKATIPTQDQGYFPSRTVNVKVQVLGDSLSYGDLLTINDQWFRHKDSPIDLTTSFFSLAANNKLYYGLSYSNEFWVCDPINNQYTKLSDFPGVARGYGKGFSIGSSVFFGTGATSAYANQKDIWNYDITSDTWSQKSDFPGTARTEGVTFVINGYGYFGGGQKADEYSCCEFSSDFWKYDPSADKWTQIADIGPNCYGMAEGASTVIGNNAYVGLGFNNIYTPSGQDQLWYVYNAVSNSWQQLSSFPQSSYYQRGIIFNLNGMPYGKVASSDFYLYNTLTDTWQPVTTSIYPKNTAGLGFAIGSLGFVGVGNELWEFDPSR